MKRNIARQVSIQRTITYSYSRADLIRLLKLPDDAILSVDGTNIDAEASDTPGDEGCSLKAHVKEAVTQRAPKEAA